MSKIEAFWQDATAEDVARVMSGETMEARFRDSEAEPWTSVRTLRGWSDGKWVSVLCWNHCQVYREPSWHADKPDPGPGWVLLGKFPDEPKLGTDECWNPSERKWQQVKNDDGIQEYQAWYRRRIEVVAKFAVGQTVRVVGPKVKPAKDWGKEMDRHVGLAGVIRSIPILEGEGTFYNLEGIGIWCFREDYLEPVEPVAPDVLHCVLLAGESAKLPNGQTITATEKGFEVKQ